MRCGWASALTVAAIGLACGPAPAFDCDDDAQCVLAGQSGTCVSGECAYPDDACDSGLRFPDVARPAVAGTCVRTDDTSSATGPIGSSTGSTGTETSTSGATATDESSTGSPDPACVASVEAGSRHTCALVGGDVWCWGANDGAQLGFEPGAQAGSPTPLRVPLPEGRTTQLGRTTQDHTCAVADDALYCWGTQANNNVDGETDSTAVPATRLVLAAPHAAATGQVFSCAALATNVTCWGDTFWGQTGLTNGNDFNALLAGIEVDQIVSGNVHTCVRLADDRSVLCWGGNDWGQLGRGTPISGRPEAQPDPMPPIGLPGPVDAVSLGGATTCALLDQEVWCWGRETNSELFGAGSTSTPVHLAALDGAIDLAMGESFGCIRTEAGAVRCWGSNGDGQIDPLSPGIARGLVDTSASLGSLTGAMSSAQTIAAGEGHACLAAGNEVLCWGRNDDGQLGDQTVNEVVAGVSLPACE